MGSTRRVSAGWPEGGGDLIGDEGSSYWLGVQAMIRAVRAYDGREGPTLLLDRVLDHLNLEGVEEIMHRLYGQGVTRAEIARLAPDVIEAVRLGDWAAHELVQTAVNDLADCVLAVAERLGMGDAPELVLVGGLMNAVDAFVAPLKEAVWERLPGCSIHRPELPPVLGACLLGLEVLGIPPEPPIVAALRAGAEKLATR